MNEETNWMNDLTSGDVNKTLSVMKEKGIAFYSTAFTDADDNPMGAVFYVWGAEETHDLEQAVRKVEKKHKS